MIRTALTSVLPATTAVGVWLISHSPAAYAWLHAADSALLAGLAAQSPWTTLPGAVALASSGAATVATLAWPRRTVVLVGLVGLAGVGVATAIGVALRLELGLTAPLTLILVTAIAATTAALRDGPNTAQSDSLRRARALIEEGRLDAGFAELKASPDAVGAESVFLSLADAYEADGNSRRAAGVRRALARRLLAGTAPPKPRRVDVTGSRSVPPTLGRYDIEGVLGRGAMGCVYLARDTRINRSVALKVVALEREFDPAGIDAAKARFFQEAESAGRLHHPAIVMVFDAGEVGELSYIAMEYVAGTPLSQCLNGALSLPDSELIELTARAAEALAYAHERRVIHRDIKPANLLYDADTDTLKIMDFGVAQLADVVRTRTGVVLGTPAYMAPEQIRGEALSGASDLYSLGVTLYELLTGQVPYPAESMKGLIEARTSGPPRAITDIRPELPASLAYLFDRALAETPSERFADGWSMADALRAAARDCDRHSTRRIAAK